MANCDLGSTLNNMLSGEDKIDNFCKTSDISAVILHESDACINPDADLSCLSRKTDLDTISIKDIRRTPLSSFSNLYDATQCPIRTMSLLMEISIISCNSFL